MTLCKPNALDWLSLYRLYLAAFPASERKPFSMIRRMYRKGRTDVWCVKKDGVFSGLAITINGGDIILLDYLAVKESCRGQGIGGAVLARLREIYAGKGLFVEIESTCEEVPDLAMRRRRKAFYQRSGLQPMGTEVVLFGVKMELLGVDCHLNFEQYHSFYRDNYNQWAAEHIAPVTE